VDNSIPKVSKVSSSAPTSPFTINTWFSTPVLALAGLGIAQQSLMTAGNAKFIRVTAKPVSHEGVPILLLVPVMTGQIRDLLRTACGTRARFPSADLVVETAKQPLLRYGVHVHDSSGNPSACVGIYRSHKLITFSNDGLYGSSRIDSRGGVDWTKTSAPITFKVVKVDSQLSSNTLHVNSAGKAVILPTVLSGADIFYQYLSSCLASPLVESIPMKETVAAHFAMETVVM